MKMVNAKITAISGFIGSGFIALGSLLPTLVYEGKQSETYSFLNHFISELGEVGVSEWAIVFNICLIIGGISLTIFMLGLALYLSGWFGVVFGLFGFVTGMSGALVGVFPMNNLETHMKVALTFFYSGMLTTFLFSIYILFSKQNKFGKLVAIPGAVTAICFFSFLFLTEPIVPEGQMDKLPEIFANRPDVWQAAIFEWSVLVTVLAFVVVVAGAILRREKAS